MVQLFIFLLFNGIIGARFPSPSPDGKEITFSYLGDIWRVSSKGGRAVRVTDHIAYDILARWSPDGSRIAFSSNRFGNYDVFVIPARGGRPTRLTYHTAGDMVSGWTQDGKGVLFYSRMDDWTKDVYIVPSDGGRIKRLTHHQAFRGRLSLDSSLVFTRGTSRWWRKGYRGSANAELWVLSAKGKTKKLTRYDGNDLWPMWSKDGEKVYFVSDRDGTPNLWELSLDGDEPKQLTFYTEDGVKFPDISWDGRYIAYERNGRIFLLSLEKGEPTEVLIEVSSDVKTNLSKEEEFTDEATELAVSGSGNIAFVVHGEVFVRSKEGGKAKPVISSPGREYQIFWSEDGKNLLFVSDREGQNDIFIGHITDKKKKTFKIKRLTRTEDEEKRPKFSPDGKWVSFLRNRGDLYIMSFKGGKERLLAKGPFVHQVSWSPDSKWIAFSRPDKRGEDDIFIIPFGGGEEVNITKNTEEDWNPIWSTDGECLFFLSERKENTDIWRIPLKKEEEEEEKEGEEVKVEIEFKGIYERAEQVTKTKGDDRLYALSPDGSKIAFKSNTVGRYEIWVVGSDGKGLKQLTNEGINPTHMSWDSSGKAIYFLNEDGEIWTISIKDKKRRRITFSAKVEIDFEKEREQIFEECWRALNVHFYDPDFHGVDWKGVKEKYKKFLPSISMREDLHLLIEETIGELNASHLGIYPPEDKTTSRTAYLGVILDEEYEGKGLKVKEVLPDGPCEGKVKGGERILKIDGVEIAPEFDFHRFLNGKKGEEVELVVDKRTETVKLIGRREFLNLLYKDRIRKKKGLVEEWSGGELGYIHIRSMGRESLEKFKEELLSEVRNKKGLILDVRNNPGGWIHDRLLRLLERRPYSYYVPRGGEKYLQPSRLWAKPIVLLVNEYSGSDAEIFPYSFRALGLGKILGVTTAGAVIGTGHRELLDGSWFNIPTTGWYTLKGENLENLGVRPDIFVENEPDEEYRGKDTQLKRAVELLLKEIEE